MLLRQQVRRVEWRVLMGYNENGSVEIWEVVLELRGRAAPRRMYARKCRRTGEYRFFVRPGVIDLTVEECRRARDELRAARYPHGFLRRKELVG